MIRYIFFTLIIISLLFAETYLPYDIARKNCAPNKEFLGQIYEPWDQNMHFSFIRQADSGHFIFNDRLTYLPNDRVFVNVEFWLVGFLQRLTGSSENGIYQVWRFLGILALVSGFSLLAGFIFTSGKRYLVSVIAFLFGGGFGFLFIHLNSTRFNGSKIMKYGTLDLWSGQLPFQQATISPHLSMPHGFVLLSFVLFLYAEKKNKIIYYVLTGIMFSAIGLMRPYDLISIFAIIPLFIVVQFLFAGHQIKPLIKRSVPLLVAIPVLIYNIWLFKFSDVFRYWSIQGANASSLPTAPWHYLSFGVLGILAIVRMGQIKNHPLNKNEIFMAVWFLATFALAQAGKIIPMIGFSPQIGTPLLGPLAILGCSVHLPGAFKDKPKYHVYAAGILLAAIILTGNIAMLQYTIKTTEKDKDQTKYYADKCEANAWDWLNKNTTPGQVVLAGPVTSSRICKYTNASVVMGHYSVTPRYNETCEAAFKIFYNDTWDEAQRKMLSSLNTDYVYLGPEIFGAGHLNIDTSGYMKLAYRNEFIAIYKVTGKNK